MQAKISITIVFLLVLLSGTALGEIALAGKLLQSNGRPLAYTEIELVEMKSSDIANDGRITAISNTLGKFSFANVPDGNYTLSINFNEKPTETSPFTTFFYPNTENRSEARIFEFDGTSKFLPLAFRLPPKLLERKVSGKVLWSDSVPVAGAMVVMNDVEFDDVFGGATAISDRFGNFTLKGFSGRKYLVRAVLFKYPESAFIETLSPILAAGISDIFTLTTKTEKIRILLEEDPETKNLRQRNIGKLILKP